VLAAFIPSTLQQARPATTQVCKARSNTITMAKKSVGTLGEADLKGKKVFVRVDLNVPLDGKKITDDTRIRASVPTIKYLQEKGAKVSPPLARSLLLSSLFIIVPTSQLSNSKRATEGYHFSLG